MKEGDHEARNTLIERNLRLVAHVTRKYQGTDYEMEDLLSIGTIGLIKAVNTFHPERGSRLATYAAKCIENEILMTFRAGKKYAKDISLYDPIGVDKDGETVSRMDVLEAEGKEVLETIILKQEIEQLYRAYEACLKETEKIVLRSRYGLFGGKEQTQREIAARLGISRSYVSRIEKRALEKCGEFAETQIKNRKSGWQMLGWTSVSRFLSCNRKFSQEFPIAKGTNVPMMRTRAKQKHVASDRARRENVAKSILFHLSPQRRYPFGVHRLPFPGVSAHLLNAVLSPAGVHFRFGSIGVAGCDIAGAAWLDFIRNCFAAGAP